MQESRICAAILAGGKSSRMGRNKALLELGGKTIIEHVIQVASTASSDVMLITNSPGNFSHLKLPMLPDEVRDIGPLGGIYTALKHCRTAHCLILACDLPFLSGELVRFLSENAGDADIFAIDAGKGPEPLCAVYAKRCLPTIEAQIAHKNFKVADLFKCVNARVIQLSPGHCLYSRHLFYNINSPDDLKQASALRTGRQALDQFNS